jgi:hypothetical protein
MSLIFTSYNFIFRLRFSFMVFNTTFNNISVISWQSVLSVEETEVPRENHWPAASHWQTLPHNVVSSTWAGFKFTMLVVIDTDCIGSCKPNYHTMTTMTAPFWKRTYMYIYNGHSNLLLYSYIYIRTTFLNKGAFIELEEEFCIETIGSDCIEYTHKFWSQIFSYCSNLHNSNSIKTSQTCI